MGASEEIKTEMSVLIELRKELLDFKNDSNGVLEFGAIYQSWYSRAIKIVEALAPERLSEFNALYYSDPKRKSVSIENYSIQDFIKGFGAPLEKGKPLWDSHNLVKVRVTNQIHILSSLSSRIDSVLQDVKGHLFAEIQDHELGAATKLLKINIRAAGALAGVVLERHLQRVASSRRINIKKSNPTIADLNDPLKSNNVYEIQTWRKIQMLADIRNICSHQKSVEPTKEDVEELIVGVNRIIKSVF